jgi:hypothetical protein
MAISDDIVLARGGVIHCGVSAQTAPSLTDLAREFGLRADMSCYREIDEASARRLATLILHRDLAYNVVIMPEEKAAQLAGAFLDQFGASACYFTNGTLHEPRRKVSPHVSDGWSWGPVTDATFDTGVLVLGPEVSGCLWVEDED